MKKKLTYQEFKGRDRFDKAELLAFAHGTLVEDAPETFVARLPTSAPVQALLGLRHVRR